ncbi:MAG: uracil-DNA glycosylase [Bdellovibrionaceae bacterium]|nr:uracil-DNA glycosylase [Pseudobdellovibrionaceae bacterium]
MQSEDKIKLEPSWKKELLNEFQKPYMAKLKGFLQSEIQKGKVIYPRPHEYFEAFNQTPLDQVKVVILGQDPYHGPLQAHGLCFSVQKDIAIPPSLQNIYKELKNDIPDVQIPKHGHLTAWAKQGVLLLNATLTVERAKAASHQKKGWEEFTDAALKIVNESHTPKAFILWGSSAQKKGEFLDSKKHLVIKAVHPSPLSAHRGFFGHKPFSRVNEFLMATGQTPIDWSLD